MLKGKLVGMGLWALLMLGQYAVTACGQTSCPLASGGQPLLPVIVSANANASVIESAEELADYLGRITGAGFIVQVGDGTAGIAVGMTNDFPALQSDQTLHLAERFAATNESMNNIQSYVLQSRTNGVVVVGGSELAVEYAVWDLLYKLGYRKFFPGDAWEVIPSLPSAALATDVFEKPDYVDRRIWYGFGGDAVRQRVWNFRNRMNHHSFDIDWRFSMPAYLKTVMIDVTEGYGDIITINQDVFDAHPEYYALIGGQRIEDVFSKLCLSNTNVQQLALSTARYMFDTDPDLHHFSVSMEPSDGGGWCECANCAALGTPSTRLAVLANYVAKGLETTHPDKWVGILAYNENTEPPATNVHSHVWVECATLLSGSTPVQERLQGWHAQGARVGIYDYWGLSQWRAYLPAQGNNLAYMFWSIPEYHKFGARVMCAESGENWGPKGLEYYVASRLLWSTNVAANAQALTDDFFVKAFGAAAEPMRKFYDLMDIAKNVENGNGVQGTVECFVSKYTQMYAALLWAADAAGADAAIQARLDDLFLYTRFVQLYCDWELSGKSQASVNQLILFAYRIRETGMVHWASLLSCIEGATSVDLTPPPSCVTPELRAEARAAAVLVTANSPVHAPVATGLVAHWMLDETGGTTMSDATGNGNAGTLISGPTWTNAGKIGGALSFDGIDDYVDIGDKLNPGGNSWTIALWFKAEAVGGFMYDKARVYEGYCGGGYCRYAWMPHWAGDGDTTFPVTAGQWHHSAVVYDKTNQYLYKDGVLVYSRPQTGDIGTATSAFLLGAYSYNGSVYGFFKGVLDDVRVYNKALTATEVAAVAAINQVNHIPVTVSNVYSTTEDTPLTVAAPGVLGNDSDADGDTLTVTKEIDPSNGKYGADHGLALNTNGAFTYTPRKDWNGTDSFTYRANDGRGAAMSATVTITVTPVNDAPECAIANPVNGATFPAPAAITINADALDVDGSVTKVEFYNGAAKLGEDASSPYNFDWNGVAIGSYALTVRETDNSGAMKTSAVVNVSVVQSNAVPACSISSPATGAAFIAPAAITINVSASDSDGSIAKVEFYNGVTKMAEDASSPYSFAWTNVALGGYALTARATDNRGAVTTSAVVNVTANDTVGTNGLVAHWMLDETYGMTAADSTGNGNAGALSNGPTWTSSGKVGGSLYFDGVDDYVDIGNKLNPGSSSWTVALWFKSYASGGFPYDKENLYQSFSGAGYFKYAWRPDWAADGGASFPVTEGRWYHAVTVYDKTNQYLYRNGVLVYSRPQTGDIGSNVNHFLLGAYGCNGSVYGFFKGMLDDVRVYNKALTAAEIAELAAMGQANIAPTCSISSPANGAEFTAPASITINATAADSDGSVTKVEFYNGAAKWGEDTSSPYSLVTNNVAAGSYALTVRAADNSGAIATSAVVNVTVNGAIGSAGLVAHWMLDETNGTTAADETGNGNAGTLIGGATWTNAGKIGGALIFDGTDDYVDIGNKLNPGSSNWTVALWFKAETAGGFMYDKANLYQGYCGGGYCRYAWIPHWVGDGDTSFPVTAGQWQHVVVVYDKTNQYLYKDGGLVYSRSQTGDMGSNVNHFLLGAYGYNGSVYGFFKGALDDVRVYNKALTATEVAAVAAMNQTNAAPTCSISSPANEAEFTAPASITINADAADSDGSVAKVEFYNGAAKLGEDTSSPYSLVTNNVAAGSYALTVRATDNGGAITTSAVVNITVNGAGGGANGLVAHWMLDETNGTTAADETGNGNTGTLVSGPAWTSAGKIGGALNFDGTDDYVDIGNKLNPGSSSWTVALWFKAETAGGFMYDKANLYQGYCGGGYCRYAWIPHWAGDGDTSFPVTAGQWHHAVTVYDKTNQYLYKDGVLVYSRPQTGDIGSNVNHLLLGAYGYQGSVYGFFKGALDDVRVYNKALSAAEIAELAAIVPSPWETQDIGAVGAAGNAAYSNGTFTIRGSGAGIGGTADQFRYVYQVANGDCEIKARVASVQNVNTWSKAGVMVRETLVDNARQALTSVTAGSGVLAQWRASTGGSTSSNISAGLAAPYWVRVVRTGSSFIEYNSTNGTDWVAMNTQSVSMASSVYIGLAVSSHVTSNLCTAVIDNVNVTP